MDPGQYDLLASIERDHWWYRTVRWTIGSLLGARTRPDGGPARVLDLGAGTGAASSDLHDVVAVDSSERAMAFLRDRPVRPIRADAAALPLPPSSFDVLVAVNVLYTVADPDAVLAEAARVLAPGGALVLIEPAFPAFERAHDRYSHGRRRFRRKDLTRSLEQTGLRVERSTYLFSFGAPAAALQGFAYRFRPSVGDFPSSINRWPLKGVLGAMAAAERTLLRRLDLPVGTSVAVLAHHPLPPRARSGASREAARPASRPTSLVGAARARLAPGPGAAGAAASDPSRRWRFDGW